MRHLSDIGTIRLALDIFTESKSQRIGLTVYELTARKHGFKPDNSTLVVGNFNGNRTLGIIEVCGHILFHESHCESLAVSQRALYVGFILYNYVITRDCRTDNYIRNV